MTCKKRNKKIVTKFQLLMVLIIIIFNPSHDPLSGTGLLQGEALGHFTRFFNTMFSFLSERYCN